MRWLLFYSYWVLYELHEREDWLALILLLRGPCRGVTRLDGAWARSKFGAPVSKTEVFWKHMFYALKKVLVTLLGLFGGPQPLGAPCTDWRPHSDSEPGNGTPVAPIVTSLEPWLAGFCVVAATYEKPKSIYSYLNGCTIHDTEFRFNKAKNCLEN